MAFKLEQTQNFFFVGIAGTGMSAIAQYLRGVGKDVSGSDRLFGAENKMLIQQQFEEQGIYCFFQDGSGVTEKTEVLVVSTAIEPTNVEYKKAEELGITILKRSELLAAISESVKTIAVGGTSGKSTTTAMIFHILQECGVDASLITGAGLSVLQKKGLPGNAWVGKSDWLVIEADESDGSIVNYKPEIGLLLNIDRDHKEFDELIDLFSTFKSNSKSYFVVNQNYKLTKDLSQNIQNDFGFEVPAGFVGTNFKQEGFSISFDVNNVACKIPVIGKHNMENALASIAVVNKVGLSIKQAISSLQNFEGIYRRTQLVGKIDSNIYVIDDFAHNPAECAAAIRACQNIGERVIAWFQPHGFGPLRFMKNELAEQITDCLRKDDVFFISDVYYAGGTVDKNVNPKDVSDAIKQNDKKAGFVGDKENSQKKILETAKANDVVIIMGARDPYLDVFAKKLFDKLQD